MTVSKTSFTVPAVERLGWETSLEEDLAEAGFVVTSNEISRDGPWRIEIFGEAEDRIVAKAIARGAAVLDVAIPPWEWESLPDIDWVAENQRSFQPFAVGSFWVHPSHASANIPPELMPLRIDAGMAFGTGTHATTRGCLELLSGLSADQITKIADVGCGSGILAIAMAKLWGRNVLGGDNDHQAVEVARENAILNGVDDVCRFVLSAGLQASELSLGAPYDLVVANILAGPLMELSESFAAAIRPGGNLLLSGLLVEQAADLLALYQDRGFAFTRRIDLETGGACWRTLLLRRQ